MEFRLCENCIFLSFNIPIYFQGHSFVIFLLRVFFWILLDFWEFFENKNFVFQWRLEIRWVSYQKSFFFSDMKFFKKFLRIRIQKSTFRQSKSIKFSTKKPTNSKKSVKYSFHLSFLKIISLITQKITKIKIHNQSLKKIVS